MTQTNIDTQISGSARSTHVARPFWVDFVRHAFVSASGMVALLLVAVQAIWRGSALARGWYTQDDYLHLRDARAGLNWDQLTSVHSAEFSPVGKLLTWVGVQLGGTGWTGAAVIALVLQTAVALLLWVVLTQILPGRWIRVPLLAAVAFSPLTLSSTFGWNLAVMYLPAALCLLVAAAAALAHQQQGWAPGNRVAGAALLVALLCTDRAVVMPVILFFLLASVLEPGALGVVQRLRHTLLDHLRLWLVLLLAVVVRIVLGAFSGHASFGVPSDSGLVLDSVEEYFRQLLSGLVGGPWAGEFANGALSPERTWVFAVALLVGAATAVPILARLKNPEVAVAVIGVVVAVALTLVMLVMTRSGVSVLGMVTRHGADAVLMVALLGAAALRGVPVPAKVADLVARSSAGSALLVTLALVISGGVTQQALVPHLQNQDDRSFVETLRGDLERNPATVLLDGPVPAGILHPWFGDDARVSTVADLLPEEPTFDLPSAQLRLVDGLGILREVDLGSSVQAFLEPGECATRISSESTRVTFPDPVADGDVVLEFDYLAGADVYVRVRTGENDVRVPLRKGLGTMQVPLQGGFRTFDTVLDADSASSSVCLAKVRSGVPTQGAIPGQG